MRRPIPGDYVRFVRLTGKNYAHSWRYGTVICETSNGYLNVLVDKTVKVSSRGDVKTIYHRKPKTHFVADVEVTIRKEQMS